MSTDTTHESHSIAARPQSTELSVEAVLGRLEKIQDLAKRAMVKDVDYGIIPGTGTKQTLLKPGAEKLAVMFRMAPRYRTQKTFHDDGHLTVESTCQILDFNESFLGEASAMCSTREAKYAYRKGERVCPQCGKPNIRKSKEEKGGGWYCWVKTGGCGKNFPKGDPAIESQTTERVANPDVPDCYNTVLRIAEKRAFIGAMRLVTGSSALFDEEIPGGAERDDEPNGAPPEHENMPPPPTAQTIKPANVLALKQWLAHHKLSEAKFCASFGIGAIEDLSVDHAADAYQKAKSGYAAWKPDRVENPEADVPA